MNSPVKSDVEASSTIPFPATAPSFASPPTVDRTAAFIGPLSLITSLPAIDGLMPEHAWDRGLNPGKWAASSTARQSSKGTGVSPNLLALANEAATIHETLAFVAPRRGSHRNTGRWQAIRQRVIHPTTADDSRIWLLDTCALPLPPTPTDPVEAIYSAERELSRFCGLFPAVDNLSGAGCCAFHRAHCAR